MSAGVITLADGHLVVPGNRWDLVDLDAVPPPTVTVVVPYYRQPQQLSLLLDALERQTHPADRLRIVIADDGSPEPPVVRSGLDVTVVRQDDRGFRAAAARNLGARAATGEVLCFLDADTVPEPEYVERLTRLPALVPDAITVGRRRHADLSSSGSFRRLHSSTAEELPEPQWLIDAYRGSRNLLDADWRSYRHVISAVMCCSRALFEEIGGFDESFTQYGGEDWELANRAYLAGAVLAHVPDAVAWHDGPDWAGRSDSELAAKNAEALALSPLITDPFARTHGVQYAAADLSAVVRAEGHTAASLLTTVGSILRYGDVRVWVQGDGAEDLVAALGIEDARVQAGPSKLLQYSRFGVDVRGRVVFDDGALRDLAERTDVGRVRTEWPTGESMTWWSSRAVRRSRRWAERAGLSEDAMLQRLFGEEHPNPDHLAMSIGPEQPNLAW